MRRSISKKEKKITPTWPKGAWDPKRNGETYCSKACGGMCTWQSFQLATAKAEGLAAGLGADWKANVWENLGWHWEVVFGTGDQAVKVSQRGPTSYEAHIGGGKFWGKGATARDAIRATRKLVESDIAYLLGVRAVISTSLFVGSIAAERK